MGKLRTPHLPHGLTVPLQDNRVLKNRRLVLAAGDQHALGNRDRRAVGAGGRKMSRRLPCRGSGTQDVDGIVHPLHAAFPRGAIGEVRATPGNEHPAVLPRHQPRHAGSERVRGQAVPDGRLWRRRGKRQFHRPHRAGDPFAAWHHVNGQRVLIGDREDHVAHGCFRRLVRNGDILPRARGSARQHDARAREPRLLPDDALSRAHDDRFGGSHHDRARPHGSALGESVERGRGGQSTGLG